MSSNPFQNDDLFDVFESKKRKTDENPQPLKFPKFEGTDEKEEKKEEKEQTQPNNEQQEEVKVSASFLVSKEACKHEIALPPNYQGEDPLKTQKKIEKPAKEYPYTLDAFQREAVNALENHQSVLVSAHTSAGKTTVGEYAIAMSLRDKARCIYTSPIKALSNQKYRDFSEEFKDVGLMTGDVTISPNASCVVMTTEILRSMLYKGSELLNEVAWVIFDEVHYMRDKDRGVVWEETMVLLPSTIKYVFLSATIPNALEFAQWIAKLKGQPVHVVYTDYRPTPLQQYIFPEQGDGIHLVIDEKGKFREDNFQKAVSLIKNPKPKGGSSDIYKIVKMIMERNFQPAIIFSFSKRDCENYATQMSKLDFNTDDEKILVEEVFTNAIDSLGDDDKKLPQVEHILPLLKRGIGIHHSGLLPVIKEVIEILFQEGLCKALFSTETFSLGLNMPARTVVFTSLQKFDGKDFRIVSGGEYIQMSGRAGRRGIDDKGVVIMMLSKKDNHPDVRKLFSGHSDSLNSSFRLSYYMILNLLRVEEITPEYIMERSFYQHQTEKNKPEMEKRLNELIARKNEIKIENEEKYLKYHEMSEELIEKKSILKVETSKPAHCLKFIEPGRLVYVKDQDQDWGWGIVVNLQKKKTTIESNNPQDYTVDVLLKYSPLDKGIKATPKPSKSGEEFETVIIPIRLDLIEAISSVRTVLHKNLKTDKSRNEMGTKLQEILKRLNNKPPLLDPVDDFGIKDKNTKQLVDKIKKLEDILEGSSLKKNDKNFSLFMEKYNIEKEIKQLEVEVQSQGKLILKDDLKKMMRVLRRLEFTSSENVIQIKGRTACEINSADELIVTEMIFNGMFNDLTCEQCVSLLSCLVFTEGNPENAAKVRLPEELEKPYQLLLETAKKVAKISVECKMDMNEQDYVNSFSPQLMEIVFKWMKGAKFYEICRSTDIFEGSIVRAMRRLEELVRQVVSASRVIGDENLEKKFKEGILKLKRDIVFSNSLYL